MNFKNLPGKIFFQNRFIDSNLANVHVLSHSLHFASAVFEGIRVYNYKPFFLVAHLQRLLESCELMMIEPPYSKEKIIDLCLKLIKKNKLKNGYIRPIVYKGPGSMAPESANCKAELAMAGWEWKSLFNDKKSIKINLSSWRKPHESVFPVKAKSSGSYQIATLAKNEALLKGYDDALLLDTENFIAEGTACNVFWRKNDVIYTPMTHSILNGITRRVVIKVIKKLQLPLKIGNFSLNELTKADEVFFTGTAAEVMNILSLDDYSFKSDELTKILKSEYNLLKEKKEIALDD